MFLNRWMGRESDSLNLADVTAAFPTDGAFGAKDCLKGLDIETGHRGPVHPFRSEDLAKLSSVKIRLVDDKAQEKEIEKHDPGKAIREGRSVDDAVKNGFLHGKAWFSEILFDKTHTHAVVFYGFHCGSLCGNGGTAILEKQNGVWKVKSQCGIWMS